MANLIGMLEPIVRSSSIAVVIIREVMPPSRRRAATSLAAVHLTAIRIRSAKALRYSLRGDGGRQHVVLKLLAQCGLLNLPRRGMRDRRNEDDVVRHPPFSDLAVEVTEDFLLGGGLPFL